ncbi:hypothetical protein MIND_00327100 [Mycena indigotica]|uniref:C2H2-type domain-containing protein n=1 Tax=Mycena indigotica TaxID=2126181 RepID=A0A8H6T1Z4_9AGAR|nr:uncharacterized protein MIND_00327100 [Mycena indigotica]KAF7309561.1 hypothetical protein MIND_00327100 [Mycena indigotica]
MSSKRNRTSSSESSTSASTSPNAKAQRTNTENSKHPLLCTLPPTCHQHHTHISSSKDLEAHYATYHAHVCETCSCVFPEARILELHQTECHDPLAAVRRERGEKIFACHLVSCDRLFQTPKGRRLHLIQVHGYPKEYFFAVTNKGVGGLLKRWGEGASLIRGKWKPREAPTTPSSVLIEEDESENDQETAPDIGIDSLTSSLNALSLVPSAIRFGRGGKSGGFGRTRSPGPANNRQQRMDVDAGRDEETNVLTYVPRGVRVVAQVRNK